MVKSIKRILGILPETIQNRVINTYLKIKLNKIQRNHKKALKKVKRKEKIRVVFLVIHAAVWKLDYIFRRMTESNRFNPSIIVCPEIRFDEITMHKFMDEAYVFFEDKGYKPIKSYDRDTGKWLDIKKDIDPDLVFFTNPWPISRSEYLIGNFLDTLTCYVPYGFKMSHLYHAHFNLETQNYVWKFFLETRIHQKLSEKYARNSGNNTLVTGYPGMDELLETDSHNRIDVWKIKNRNIKRIIWAPHHTIPGFGSTLDYSTFLYYYEFMFEIAEKYKDKIQISFKPHPLLITNLRKPEIWGLEKADMYYKRWEELENGQLNEGNYINLFLASDALIHDSGSFLVEYLYTNKPSMFLISDDNITDRFNEVGKLTFAHLYHGRCKDDVIDFVENVVVNDRDPKKKERIQYFDNVIKPPNNKLASENIIDCLNDILK